MAEGVEASEQASQLRTLQCELGQGYYFAQPLDADQVAALLADHESAAPLAVQARPRPPSHAQTVSFATRCLWVLAVKWLDRTIEGSERPVPLTRARPLKH